VQTYCKPDALQWYCTTNIYRREEKYPKHILEWHFNVIYFHFPFETLNPVIQKSFKYLHNIQIWPERKYRVGWIQIWASKRKHYFINKQMWNTELSRLRRLNACHITKSNLIEIQRIETATYIATWRIFRENIFYIFEKLNNQCKVDTIFIKSFYLNGKTEFY